jgi:hypothetical protein
MVKFTPGLLRRPPARVSARQLPARQIDAISEPTRH